MSAASSSPPLMAQDLSKDPEKHSSDPEIRHRSIDYGKNEDILGQQDVDAALNAKMHIVNNVSYKIPS
jgi:hypothetical protein